MYMYQYLDNNTVLQYITTLICSTQELSTQELMSDMKERLERVHVHTQVHTHVRAHVCVHVCVHGTIGEGAGVLADTCRPIASHWALGLVDLVRATACIWQCKC